MHLAELLALSARPAAGLLLALTERCPLACAHCSTDSTMASPQSSGAPFRQLVGSFRPDARPDAVLMSGGEPLLRPGLVRDLASGARRAGARSTVLSGMFFARGGGVPPAVLGAVDELDHFGASIDRHHEREVDRADVFAALAVVLERVPGVSLHITTDAAPDDRPDAYVDGLVRDVRSRFGTRVPMLVSRVQPTGRARTDAPSDRPPVSTPCQFAGWPLVDHDGTVYACTRQSLLRTVRPAHLVLGHASRDAWTTLRDRTLGDPLLRSVRMFGPLATRDRFDAPGPGCGSDGCTACVALSDGEAARTAASDYLDSESGGRVERAVLQLSAARPPRRLAAARGAVGRYAELTELGWKSA